MYHLGDPTGRRGKTRQDRGVRYACLGAAALLLAGLLAPTPGTIAAVSIAATTLMLMGAQHFAAQRLAARGAERIGRRESLSRHASGEGIYTGRRQGFLTRRSYPGLG